MSLLFAVQFPWCQVIGTVDGSPTVQVQYLLLNVVVFELFWNLVCLFQAWYQGQRPVRQTQTSVLLYYSSLHHLLRLRLLLGNWNERGQHDQPVQIPKNGQRVPLLSHVCWTWWCAASDATGQMWQCDNFRTYHNTMNTKPGLLCFQVQQMLLETKFSV